MDTFLFPKPRRHARAHLRGLTRYCREAACAPHPRWHASPNCNARVLAGLPLTVNRRSSLLDVRTVLWGPLWRGLRAGVVAGAPCSILAAQLGRQIDGHRLAGDCAARAANCCALCMYMCMCCTRLLCYIPSWLRASFFVLRGKIMHTGLPCYPAAYIEWHQGCLELSRPVLMLNAQ